MSYEAAQRMVPQRSGKIINICSVFSFLGGRQAPAYAATKHGIAGLTKAYCDELAAAQHPGQRDRAGLLRDRAHGGDAERPGAQPARARSHPGRPLGRAGRPDGRGRLPREPRLGLRQRAHPRRWTAATSSARAGSGARMPRPVPDRHRRRHPEHEGRRRRRRGATSSRRAGEPLRPMSRPAARRRLPSRRRPLGLARRGEPPGDGRASTAIRGEIAAVGLCTIRCCKAFLEADGSLVEPVISWMDDRAYLPYLPDDPALAYATTSSGYLGHRLTGAFRDSAANNILLQWPIDVDTLGLERRRRRCSSSSGCGGSMLFELQLPGEVDRERHGRGGRGDGHPGRASRRRRPRTTRRSRRSAPGPLGEHDGARLARHLHRRDGARAARTTRRRRPSGRTSPASRTATSTRATACAAACGRSAGSSTSSAPELAERAATLGVSREELIEDEAASRAGRQRRPDDRARLARPHRGTVPQGRDARVRRPAHARATSTGRSSRRSR